VLYCFYFWQQVVISTFLKTLRWKLTTNFDALMARIMKTETTPAATSPSPAVNTAESTPGVEPVTSASAEKLSTESPQETENISRDAGCYSAKRCKHTCNKLYRTKNLGEEIRTTLETMVLVSSGNGSSLKHVSSAIIEKKENVSGEELGNLLNIKRIRKEIDPSSRFDFIIILGDDFNLDFYQVFIHKPLFWCYNLRHVMLI